ncbi:hypothetical protein RHGRI_024174 [Rhododendron griersonianum]|uniref:Non-specific serine/threonine protein kinase n=1 Tax=Rhododendron griersonianum TaxID=479676 RepID=A0AAV6J6A0_9ERIC|nr:hypothetical protein RHGRI_024174 [Rhododendron griersonianum]
MVTDKDGTGKFRHHPEGIKLLNTWLEGERSTGFVRYIGQKTAMLKPSEIRHCRNLHLVSVAKLLFNHIWDVLKDVPSFQHEYGIILRHLLVVKDYRVRMRVRVYCSLVIFHIEKVQTNLSVKNSTQSNPKEDVFRCILTLHSLLENPPGVFPSNLREGIVKGIVTIFSFVRSGTTKDDKCGNLTSSQCGVVELAALVFYQDFIGRIMNDATVSHTYDCLLWALRSLHQLSFVLLLSVSRMEASSNEADAALIVLGDILSNECPMLNEGLVRFLPAAVYALCAGCAPLPLDCKELFPYHSSKDVLVEECIKVCQSHCYQNVRLPHQLRVSLLQEMETYILEALLDKELEQELLCDLFYKCALLSSFMFGSYITRVREEVSPFFAKMGQHLLKLLDCAISVIGKSHNDVRTGCLSTTSIFEGMTSIMASCKSFVRSPLFNKWTYQNVIDVTLYTAVSQSIERLLKALVLYEECSPSAPNFQSEIELPDFPASISCVLTSPSNSSTSMIMDMELDLIEDSKDLDAIAVGRKTVSGVSVSSGLCLGKYFTQSLSTSSLVLFQTVFALGAPAQFCELNDLLMETPYWKLGWIELKFWCKVGEEKVVAAKEVSAAGPQPRPTMETIIITLMHLAMFSEKIELEVVFMMCVISAIDPSQRLNTIERSEFSLALFIDFHIYSSNSICCIISQSIFCMIAQFTIEMHYRLAGIEVLISILGHRAANSSTFNIWLVGCCIPLESNSDLSGTQSSQVLSLLIQLTVNSDPSLYDYIKFVKRSCYLPPRLLLCSLKALHKKLVMGVIHQREGKTEITCAENDWCFDDQSVQAVWRLVQMCGLDEGNSLLAWVSDLISKVGIGDTHSVVFHLSRESGQTHFYPGLYPENSAEANFHLDTGISEDLAEDDIIQYTVGWFLMYFCNLIFYHLDMAWNLHWRENMKSSTEMQKLLSEPDGSRFSHAATALHEFKFLCARAREQNSALYWLGRAIVFNSSLKRLKLLRAQGQHEMAINLAKYISQNHQSSEVISDVYRLVGKWLAESQSSNSRTILEKYLKRAVLFAEDRVMKKDLNSNEWQAAMRLRKHKGEKIDYLVKIQELQKQLAMDKEEDERFQGDRDNFLSVALEGYKRCLVIGDKYDVRVVFRLVSLWFSLSSRQIVVNGMLNTIEEFSLASLVKKMAIDHYSYHTIFQANGDRIKDKQRRRNLFVVDMDKKLAAENLLQELSSYHGAIIRQMKQIVEIYIKLAELETKREVPVVTSSFPVDRSCQYPEGSFPHFKGLAESVTLWNNFLA